MDLFGMGTGEILLIVVVALIIWGPGRIVEIARTLGKTVRAFRKAASDLTTAVTKEVNIEEKDYPSQSGLNSTNKIAESPNVGMTESSDAGTARSKDQ